MEKDIKEQPKKNIQQALLELSRFNYDSIEESFKMITETTSMVLGVELVSIWLYDAEQSTLTCHDSFKSSKNLHTKGIIIYENLYPIYFKTIKTEEIISVKDVFTEYKLSELLEAYIKPYGITSMMDVPVRRHGVICGVLCCEHTGQMRNWPQEEQDFVIAVSNLISLAIETHEKRKSEELLRLREKALEKARKELEVRVKERTTELEKTNEMLKFENLMRQKTEQELHYRLSVEEILSSISGRFINITSDALDREIETSLKIIGEFLSIDRCYISIISYDGIITEVYEWCAEGRSYLSGHYKNLNIETFPWYAEKLRNFEVINISSMDEFQGQEDEKKFFLSQGIKSFLTIPMYLGHELTGKFGLVSEKKEKKWNESDVVVLKMVGEIFANVLERKKTEEIIKKSKEAAEQANIAKSQFLATMSHEIRTPLNAIIGMTSLLMETTVTEEQKEFIETIRISSDNLLRIISDILDFSKIEAERFELEYQPFNLRTCIEEALNLIFPKSHPENIEILYVFHNDTPQCIRGDLTKVMQILVNLLSNAVKFTEKGDIILTVSSKHISKQDYEILFAVKDSGIGIAQDKLNLLFRPFFQVDNSTKRKYEGTGLGLAISKKLCEMMGGSMWLESEENKGTTFYFTIMARASYDIPWDFPHGNQQKLSGKRLLLVNDRELTGSSLTSYCTDWGMDVTSSSSAGEALSQIINEKNFDAVIIDISLADMDNRKVVSEIHKYLTHKKVSLIMFSPMREQFKTTSPEIILYLTKPFKPLELYSTLNKIFTDCTDMKSFFPEELQDKYEDKSIRILLAEDRVINQKVALRLLKHCGYVADIASNGLEVLDALKRQIYDVILMDVQMPEMDGLETTRIIRKEFPGARQPWIIAMTAGAFTHDRDECFMAGMNDYISKPIKLDKLKESLRKCKRLEVYETCLLPPIADMESKEINISFNHKEIFDRQELMKNLDDDEELFKELIDIFLDTIPSEIASLKEALNRKDFVMARRFAHSIKGVSGNIKANALSSIALNIEMAVKEDDIERVSLLLPDIEEEFLKFKRFI